MAKKKLDTYRAKRDFEATPEPAGQAAPAGDAPRFVIQEHSATRLHWDLRLEHDGVLASWAVPNGIPEDPSENRKAVHTEDHPLEYLDFHGEIPKGSYGAGTMTIWDHGTYELEKWEERKVIVRLHGERARGRYALFQTGEGKDWMIHRMDPPVDPAREPLPERIVPMLAKQGPLPGDSGRWAYEIKWDGVRAVAYSEPGRIRFESRTLRDITAEYPELRRLNRALSSHTAVLDGEIVAFDERGRPSFERLQQRIHQTSEAVVRRRAKDMPTVYVAFDLLYLDGRSLMELPYAERRERLIALDLNGEAWRTPVHHVGDGAALLAAGRAQGLEGVVAKRLDSAYEPGRRGGAWVKVKNTSRQELVIGGWMTGTGRRRERIGALLVGHYDHEAEAGRDGGPALRYAGKVGTGFDEAELDRLSGLLLRRQRDRSPFDGRQPPKGAEFVEPDLVAEIEFAEWTAQGMLRHPSYKGLRDDRHAFDVSRDNPEEPTAGPVGLVAGSRAPALQALVGADRPLEGGAEVTVEDRQLKFSNLGKVLYPRAGFTKGQVIDYYARVAPALLPHLRGRPLTLKRYPNGVEGKFFFEKQCPSHRPEWVRTAPVYSSRKGGDIDYCLADDLPTLLWAANLADLELHTSLSVAAEIQRPTMMVFDLDPGPPADIVQCCQVGLWLRGMFEGLGLQSFPKTSGSKGLQVYVPLNDDEASYAQTKPFAKAVAETLEKTYPELVVSRMTKSLRDGKVLVDWSQNDDSKTTVNVYSLRAKERPMVSTPVTWDEVDATHTAGEASRLAFDSEEALARLERHGDLFAPVLSEQQALPRF